LAAGFGAGSGFGAAAFSATAVLREALLLAPAGALARVVAAEPADAFMVDTSDPSHCTSPTRPAQPPGEMPPDELRAAPTDRLVWKAANAPLFRNANAYNRYI
jgi:hypothetical protein